MLFMLPTMLALLSLAAAAVKDEPITVTAYTTITARCNNPAPDSQHHPAHTPSDKKPKEKKKNEAPKQEELKEKAAAVQTLKQGCITYFSTGSGQINPASLQGICAIWEAHDLALNIGTWCAGVQVGVGILLTAVKDQWDLQCFTFAEGYPTQAIPTPEAISNLAKQLFGSEQSGEEKLQERIKMMMTAFKEPACNEGQEGSDKKEKDAANGDMLGGSTFNDTQQKSQWDLSLAESKKSKEKHHLASALNGHKKDDSLNGHKKDDSLNGHKKDDALNGHNNNDALNDQNVKNIPKGHKKKGLFGMNGIFNGHKANMHAHSVGKGMINKNGHAANNQPSSGNLNGQNSSNVPASNEKLSGAPSKSPHHPIALKHQWYDGLQKAIQNNAIGFPAAGNFEKNESTHAAKETTAANPSAHVHFLLK